MQMLAMLLMLFNGVLLGWLLARLADYAPRFAADSRLRGSAVRPLYPPAVWQLVARRRQPDLGLQLLAELLTAAALVALLLRFELTQAFVGAAAVFALLMLVALIDLKHRLVLNALTYPAAVLALLFAPDWRAALLGGLLGFGMFFAMAWLKPGQLGWGDVKLAGLLGLMFGFPGVLWALIIGVGLGAAVALALLLRRWDRAQTMPYAPFLCFGALVALIYNPLSLCLFACA